MKNDDNERSILDALQVAYFEVDLAGKVRAFNGSVCSMLGRACSEVQRTSFMTLVSGMYGELKATRGRRSGLWAETRAHTRRYGEDGS